MNREPVTLNIIPIRGIVMQALSLPSTNKIKLRWSDPSKADDLPKGQYHLVQILSDVVMEPHPHYTRTQFMLARKKQDQNAVRHQFFKPWTGTMIFDPEANKELSVPVTATALSPFDDYDLCLYLDDLNEKVIDDVAYALYKISLVP